MRLYVRAGEQIVITLMVSWPCSRYENSVDCLQWIPLSQDQRKMLLVSAGGDGVLRVWSVGITGHLMCTLQGATGHLETVKDLCVDKGFNHLFIADSSGHIRMLDISQLDTSCSSALTSSFKQVMSQDPHISYSCCDTAQKP